MNPDRTNYVTQGIDGVRRLREGPNIASFRGLSIVNSRHFSMETGAPPRDIMRRRVRVAEYYRIPPQGANTKWEVQLYDESRDTWFTMKKDELARMASLDPHNFNDRQLPPDEEVTWDEFKDQGRFPTYNNTVHLVYPDGRRPEAKLVKPANFELDLQLPSDFGAVLNQIQGLQGGIFVKKNLRRHHYKTIIDALGNFNYLRPNARIHALEFPAAPDSTRAAAWYFCHTAFLENTCALLWRPIKKIPEALMREQVCSSVPFSVLFSSPCSVSCRSFSFQCSQSRCISSMCGHRHRHIHILFPPSQTHHQLTFCNFYNVYRRKLGFSSDQDSMHKRTLHPDLPLHMRYTLACGVWCSHHLCLFSFLILILSFLQSEQITLPSGHGIAWSV